MGEFDIDITNPNNLNQKPLDEKETRRRLLKAAREAGMEKEMLLLFKKYDTALRNCTNDKERRDMAEYGCYEMYSLLGKGGELWVNNKLVCKDDILK